MRSYKLRTIIYGHPRHLLGSLPKTQIATHLTFQIRLTSLQTNCEKFREKYFTIFEKYFEFCEKFHKFRHKNSPGGASGGIPLTDGPSGALLAIFDR